MIKVMQLWIRDGDAYMQEKKQKKEINVHYLKMHTHSVNMHVYTVHTWAEPVIYMRIHFHISKRRNNNKLQ